MGVTVLLLAMTNSLGAQWLPQARGYGLALLGSVGMLIWSVTLEER